MWICKDSFVEICGRKRMVGKIVLGKTCCREVGPAAGQLVEMQRFEVWAKLQQPTFITSSLLDSANSNQVPSFPPRPE